ncbi:MAG: transglutaminaseTgpA domain-containing protein [Actinomycetales bacterium]
MTTSTKQTLVAGAATVLAAWSLTALFVSMGWFWRAALAAAVVAGAGLGARALRAPRLLVPVAQLVALLLYLTLSFVSATAYVAVLPSPAAIAAVGELIRQANDTIVTQAAPIAPTPGVLLLATAGVGAIAVLVDALAVGWRRPALAGLPLVALYVVPITTVPTGVPWWSFLLAAVGWLAVLLVDSEDRVTRWGRRTRRTGGRAGGLLERVDAAYLLRPARRLGLGAVALAVVVPVIAPSIGDGALPWSTGIGNGAGHGTSRVTIVNPILDLRKDLNQRASNELLRFTTTADAPPYIRVVTLDNFSGTTWSPTALHVPNSHDVNDGLPIPPGLAADVARTTVTTQISITDYNDSWLPLPYPASHVSVPGLWLWDGTTFNVFSTQRKTSGLDYRVESLQLQPTVAQLKAAGQPTADVTNDLALPVDLPVSVRQTAAKVAGEGSRYEQALRLQNWLRQFRYDTTAPDGNGSDAIAAFLERGSGFCVHFASAMAVMARSQGIPARVSVGFLPTTQDDKGEWVIRAQDAHAWPELYFEGLGWIRFEPTPAARTGAPPAYAPAADTGGAVAVPTFPGASAPVGGTAPGQAGGQVPKGAEPLEGASRSPGTAAGTDTGFALPHIGPWVWVVLALLALGCVPALWRSRVRARRLRRGTDDAAWARAVWEELRASAIDLRYHWSDTLTPRAIASAMFRHGFLGAEAREALERLAATAERAHYARSVGQVGDLEADLRLVRSRLAARRSRRTRVRAALAAPTLRDEWQNLRADLAEAAGRRRGPGKAVAESPAGVELGRGSESLERAASSRSRDEGRSRQ